MTLDVSGITFVPTSYKSFKLEIGVDNAYVTGIRKVLEDDGSTQSPFMHFLIYSDSERNLQYHRWSLSSANSG